METRVVDETIEQLKKNGYNDSSFVYSREKPIDESLAKRFSHSSKTGSGRPGYCDIILYNKEGNLIILVECKANAKNHGNSNEMKKNNIVDKAVPGVIHYMTHIWERGERTLGENIIGLAVSGVENRRVSIFGICNEQIQGGDSLVKPLYDGEIILSYSDVIKRLYAFDNIPGVQSISCNQFTVIGMKASHLEHIKVSTLHQRYYSVNHKEDILSSLREQLTTKGTVEIMGLIIIGYLDGFYHIIDGQHRFYAYQDLYKHRRYDFTILIQYISLSDFDNLKSLYSMHYKALEASVSEKEIPVKDWSYILAHDVFDRLATKYKYKTKSIVSTGNKGYFITRSTQVERFKKFLDKNATKYKNTSQDAIMKKLEKKNIEISQNIPLQKSNGKKPYAESVITAANNYGCWLGLIWADEWLT